MLEFTILIITTELLTLSLIALLLSNTLLVAKLRKNNTKYIVGKWFMRKVLTQFFLGWQEVLLQRSRDQRAKSVGQSNGRQRD